MLAELGARTFYDTFAKDNTPEDMATHLRRAFSPKIQLQELSEPNTLFLIAEIDERPVGYAQLILNSSDDYIKGSSPLEIRRVYASQEFLGKGVGKELMQAAIGEARQRGCDCVWLGVWEKNQSSVFPEMKSKVDPSLSPTNAAFSGFLWMTIRGDVF